MTVISHELRVEISLKDLEVWMVSLRHSAKSGGTKPYSDCPFLKQHGELVRITGFGSGDHEALVGQMRDRAEATA